MRLSNYFLPLLKENPREAEVVSHQLMLRAGMIRQLSAGIYNWLPLGLKVLKNIEKIVEEEMANAGCLQLLMPTIQPAELWQESGRFDDYGKEMLRIKDRGERDMLYGPTNEEVITDIFRKNIKSYKDLPLNLYHIQWKFRDEVRPRFGIMRGREFLMKDAYSFDMDFEGARAAYDNMFRAYIKTFRRMGLKAVPVKADSGAIGGDLSHEFQIMAKTGESELFYDEALEKLMEAKEPDVEAMKNTYAVTDEKYDAAACPVPADKLKRDRGIEVGHIFYFGKKYTETMNCKVTGSDGKDIHPECGSYGIGVSRLVGAIIESSHDENGIIWPEAVAPFRLGLINIKAGDEICDKAADDAYNKLTDAGIEVLYDDKEGSAGAKFAAMDLIGLPWQMAIGPRGIKAGTVELKNRASGEKQELSLEAAMEKIKG